MRSLPLIFLPAGGWTTEFRRDRDTGDGGRTKPVTRLHCESSKLVRVRCYLAGLLSLLIAALPGPTAAASDEDEYRKVIENAVTEFRVGNWAEARVMFRRAHQIAPSARTFRGLGMCAYEMRLYVEAIGELESALVDPRRPLTEEMRQDVQRLIDLARSYVARFAVTLEPNDAELLVDGKPVPLGQDGRLLLNPGTHTVVVRARGRETSRKVVADVGAADELSLSLVVVDQQREETVEDAPAAPPRRRHRLLAGWLASGAALGLGIVAVGYGVGVQNQGNEFQQCTADCDGIRETGERYKLITNVTAGLAGAAAVGAVVAFVVGARRGPRERGNSTFVLTPTSASYSRRF